MEIRSVFVINLTWSDDTDGIFGCFAEICVEGIGEISAGIYEDSPGIYSLTIDSFISITHDQDFASLKEAQDFAVQYITKRLRQIKNNIELLLGDSNVN